MPDICQIRITVDATAGSTPRDAGTQMLVSLDGTMGTIGGGYVEWRAIQIAEAMIGSQQGDATHAFILGGTGKQCCGGRMTLRFEASDEPLQSIPTRGMPVYLYGLGHVGQAIQQAFAPLPISVVTADSRPERQADWRDPFALVQAALPNSVHLIMTHDHRLDFALTSALLRRADCSYLGVIGSRSKRARFRSQLRAEGLDPTPLICPIGLPGLKGKEPAVIAASVVAEVLLRQSLRHDQEMIKENAICY